MDSVLKAFLKKTVLFSGLSEENLQLFLKIAAKKVFKKGEMIFSEGDAATGFYVVLNGFVRIFKVSNQGREQTLHILGPGEPFGEVAVFVGIEYPAFAAAMEKCETLFFPKDSFIAMIKEHPSIALSMLGVLSMRLRSFTRMIEDLALKEVHQRLAAYLLALSGLGDGKEAKEIRLNVSKNLLSTILGTSPETLSRAFKKMEENGLLERHNDVIQIKNFELLSDLAEGLDKLT
ncbi:Hcp transcriptional regulator HcpR (Crp/Fnr family) [Dissulfuribacter thermophilus]|uniref:Hcp transcriptional regulator HcpR (Crp/Fnr family) n=1 Tax=Dissulfuribacter thermophilus TaxID=1156395 RepID=A0A1B9F4T3_9BACT|nr:Crp/Fnr family transcriptional regulator [Dissulfuribacter thermophilus]OCC14936.1 Hcp transcriptional regulator HcpR (Crp/Fnr family) [Dissulfuribacter thermophilus]